MSCWRIICRWRSTRKASFTFRLENVVSRNGWRRSMRSRAASMSSRSSSVRSPVLWPSRKPETKPTTRSRSDQASQPVASSRHSRKPGGPPQSRAGRPWNRRCRRDSSSLDCVAGTARCGPHVPSSRPCRRDKPSYNIAALKCQIDVVPLTSPVPHFSHIPSNRTPATRV